MNTLLYIKGAVHANPTCLLLEQSRVREERLVVQFQGEILYTLEVVMADGRDPSALTKAELNHNAPHPPVKFILRPTSKVEVEIQEG